MPKCHNSRLLPFKYPWFQPKLKAWHEMRHVIGCDMTWLVMRHDMWCGLTCHYKNLIAITCACHLLLRCLVQLYLNKVRLTMNIIFIYQKNNNNYVFRGVYNATRRIFHKETVFLVNCVSLENIPPRYCLSSQLYYFSGEYST